MTERHPTLNDTYDPTTINRFKVEAAMFELIGQLLRQGMDEAEIAMALADAAEDYVIRLANKVPEKIEEVGALSSAYQ